MNRRNLTKAITTRALIQLGSYLCEFSWIYRCKRIVNADTQNIRIANADGDKNSANNFVLRPACTIFAIESEYRRRSLSVKINFHPLACTIFANVFGNEYTTYENNLLNRL